MPTIRSTSRNSWSCRSARRASPRRCAAGPRFSMRSRASCKSKGLSTAVGDEGGFAPNIASARAALDLISEAVGKAGYTLGDDVLLALDCAASEFFKDGAYRMTGEGRDLSPDEMAAYLDRARRCLSDRLDRGRHGRGRHGRVEGADRGDRRPRPARRRRSVRDQRSAAGRRHPRRDRQFDPGQGQPDRHADRDDRRGAPGADRRAIPR